MKYHVSPIYHYGPKSEIEAHSFKEAVEKYREMHDDYDLHYINGKCELRIICARKMIKYFAIERREVRTVDYIVKNITKQIQKIARKLDRN